MILLLGGTGYVGNAFSELFCQRGISYRCVSRQQVDYTNRDRLIGLIRETKPTFLINSAGYTGKPNVDACELHKAECLKGNAVLPGLIREACEMESLSWGHVSSGCIYSGTRPDGTGFTEEDTPNFSFRTNNCSFYSGCKALGEECLDGASNNFIWRLRIPFNNLDNPRNYITKLLSYQRLLEATNSLSQLDEFVSACWKSWENRIPYGIYNVTNPGHITTNDVVKLIKHELRPKREFNFFHSEEEFMAIAAKTPRSNCVMDCSKLANNGIAMTPIREAIALALRNWKSS